MLLQEVPCAPHSVIDPDCILPLAESHASTQDARRAATALAGQTLRKAQTARLLCMATGASNTCVVLWYCARVYSSILVCKLHRRSSTVGLCSCVQTSSMHIYLPGCRYGPITVCVILWYCAHNRSVHLCICMAAGAGTIPVCGTGELCSCVHTSFMFSCSSTWD